MPPNRPQRARKVPADPNESPPKKRRAKKGTVAARLGALDAAAAAAATAAAPFAAADAAPSKSPQRRKKTDKAPSSICHTVVNLSDALSNVAPSVQTKEVCAWGVSLCQPCLPNLPPPERCNINGCTKFLHHLCQIQWEASVEYEPTGCAKYCPNHHGHYSALLDAGKLVTTSLAPQQMASPVQQNMPPPDEHKCSWCFFIPCRTNATLRECATQACHNLVHTQCLSDWEDAFKYETSSFLVYCPTHHAHHKQLVKDNYPTRALMNDLAQSVWPDMSEPDVQHAYAAYVASRKRASPARKLPLGSPELLRGASIMTGMASSENRPPMNLINAQSLKPSPAESSLTNLGYHQSIPSPQQDDCINQHNPDELNFFGVGEDAFVDEINNDNLDGCVLAVDDVNLSHDNLSHEMEDDMQDIFGDEEDAVPGAESDEEGEEACLYLASKSIDEEDDDGMDSDDDDSVSGTTSTTCRLIGAPEGWSPPSPPEGYKGYEPKHNAPREEDIDNPGDWPLYCFEPRYTKSKQYIGHFTPNGAKVCPSNNNGSRSIDGWKFHYQGWKPDQFDDSTFTRNGASMERIKPVCRRGCLDVDVLKRHGLVRDRVHTDALFFFQLLFPIAPPSSSGVENDTRMPYYSNLSIFTNMYAFSKGAGSGFGHEWMPVTIPELVHWAGVPIRHGALEGTPGSLQYRWKNGDPRYDHVIADNITRSRWLRIKQFFKLNNNFEDKSRGQEGYDPCTKFDYIFKVLIHNMNYCSKRADLDQTVDESTWGFGGYCGEAGGRLMNKPVSKGEYFTVGYENSPCITCSSYLAAIIAVKGGQTTISIDIHRRYPRAYIHRHALQTAKTRPAGFAQQGPAEMVALVKQLSELVDGYKDENGETPTITINNRFVDKTYEVPKKTIFSQKPHICADNHFSGDHVMDYIGKLGFGMTCTCRRDRLPSEIKPFLHHEKEQATNPKCRVMRYQQPIIAIKQVPATGTDMAYTKTLVSFQSTGSTNIAGVNNLPSLKLYVAEKSRGRRVNKRKWGIEMNEARETYLKHYSGVDAADHMIKNTGNRYTTWRYWHAPYLHALSIGIIAAYDMYIECCDGQLDPAWSLDKRKRMSYSEFRMRLSEQMLSYDPKQALYVGDEKFRDYTKQHKKRRKSDQSQVSEDNYPNIGVTVENLNNARMQGRFCDPTENVEHHFQSFVNEKNKGNCEVCGNQCYWRCKICNKYMCVSPKRVWNGCKCAFQFHREEFFGLARSDYLQVQGKSNIDNWRPAPEAVIARNKRAIARIKADAIGNLDDGGECAVRDNDRNDDEGRIVPV